MITFPLRELKPVKFTKMVYIIEKNKQISTDNLLKIAEFVLKSNYFEFNGKFKKQLLGIAVGAKFAPTYVSIFMVKLGSSTKISGAYPGALVPLQ